MTRGPLRGTTPRSLTQRAGTKPFSGGRQADFPLGLTLVED
ncbi:hypothetical protein [Pectobacterium araliae]